MKGDINFFSALEAANKSARSWQKSSFLIPAVGLALLLVLAVTALGFFFSGHKLERETALLEQAITEPQYAEEYQNVLNAASDLGWDISHNIQVSEAVSLLKNQTRITAGCFHQIDDMAPSGVHIISYGVSDNTIGLSCTTANNLPPAEFAQILDGSGLFYEVKYVGFNGTSEQYTFNIQCVLAGGGELQ